MGTLTRFRRELAAKFLAVGIDRIFGRNGNLVVAYHGVTTGKPDVQNISVDQLREHFEYFRDNFVVDTLKNVSDRILSGVCGKTIIAIVYDDGFLNVSNAMRLHEEFGFPATVFININRNDEISARNPIASFHELWEWRKLPFLEIGSHGYSHVSLKGLGISRLDLEIRKSKDVLESFFECSVDKFTFPYGVFDQASLSLAKMYYSYVYGVGHGVINRFCVSSTTTTAVNILRMRYAAS